MAFEATAQASNRKRRQKKDLEQNAALAQTRTQDRQKQKHSAAAQDWRAKTACRATDLRFFSRNHVRYHIHQATTRETAAEQLLLAYALGVSFAVSEQFSCCRLQLQDVPLCFPVVLDLLCSLFSFFYFLFLFLIFYSFYFPFFFSLQRLS